MALSYYSSNWTAFNQLDSESTLTHQLITQDYNNNDNYNDNDNQLQPFPNDLFYSPENPNPSSLLYNNLSNEFPYDPFNWDYQTNPSFFDVQNPSNCCFPGLPEFPAGPPVDSGGSVKKKEASLSAQSVAARQRRRRITAKTQELGKLVPGGHKMNTAEMLQAAYKYIKFLQAQVEILEFVASYHDQENQEEMESDEELKTLLESPAIQEKLYSSEKCLVPTKFVQEISSDRRMVKCNPQLLSIVKQEH